ncbi:MAG TPA: hypothetical protein VGY54_07570 [Polyangiaceae bacterium]|nr:hypothetical protein [Polyangiaceae bacterium]
MVGLRSEVSTKTGPADLGTRAAWCPQHREASAYVCASVIEPKGTAMLDLLFVVIMLGSFGACLAYTAACARL